LLLETMLLKHPYYDFFLRYQQLVFVVQTTEQLFKSLSQRIQFLGNQVLLNLLLEYLKNLH